MIISGGVNIYPQEIEDLLLTHPKVYDAAVFGVPNEEFGEEVKAVIQPIDMKIAGDELADELIVTGAIRHPASSDVKTLGVAPSIRAYYRGSCGMHSQPPAP